MRKGISPISCRSCVIAVAVCLLCSASGSSQSTEGGDIHRVDFHNFTYHPTCLNWETPWTVGVKVINGSFKRDDHDGDVTTFGITDISYGDLTGDGIDEAVVLTYCNTGGTGWFDDGFVYAMRNGKPVLVARIHGGDRANGAIRSVRIESGLLILERAGNELGRALGVEYIDTTRNRLSGRKLLQVGRPVRRSFRGERVAKRIQFERGKTAAVLTGTTNRADFYVLRALEHQTLTVRVTSMMDNARFELIIDDATMAYRTTEWTGKLDARGDCYIVVVSNKGSAEYTLEVSVR